MTYYVLDDAMRAREVTEDGWRAWFARGGPRLLETPIEDPHTGYRRGIVSTLWDGLTTARSPQPATTYWYPLDPDDDGGGPWWPRGPGPCSWLDAVNRHNEIANAIEAGLVPVADGVDEER